MTQQQKIRVLIADDESMIRRGFGEIIDLQDDMCLAGEASDGQEAVEQAMRILPDVILMDIQMPIMSGIEATKSIMKLHPMTKVVILTTFDDQNYVFEGIRAGAIGYLLKDLEMEDLLESIRCSFRGEAVYRTGQAAGALSRVMSSGALYPSPRIDQLLDRLTFREREILQEMAFGLRNDQIAEKLHISEGTVKTHIHHIFQKFGAEDRTQVVVQAIRNGIVH